jgi:Na+-transporting NADH:ubiquinone oxidoreductase subunit NqrE
MSVPINHLIAEFRVNKELIVSNVDKTHLSLLSSIGVLSEISIGMSGFLSRFFWWLTSFLVSLNWQIG